MLPPVGLEKGNPRCVRTQGTETEVSTRTPRFISLQFYHGRGRCGLSGVQTCTGIVLA